MRLNTDAATKNFLLLSDGAQTDPWWIPAGTFPCPSMT